METYVARAYQIACMTREQVEQIHAIENQRLYVLPNWNIQKLLHLPSIKERFRLMDDDTLLAQHHHNLKTKLDEMHLAKTPFGYPSDGNVAATHEFDWKVWDRKGDLPFMGGHRGKKGLLEEAV